MTEKMDKPNRAFTKKFVAWCAAAAWCAVFAAIAADAFWIGGLAICSVVVPAMAGMLWGMVATYLGTANKDMKVFADFHSAAAAAVPVRVGGAKPTDEAEG